MWCVVASVLTGWLPAPAPPGGEPPRRLKPVVTWHASVDARAEGWLGRCDSEAEWRKAWDQLGRRPGGGGDWTQPEVDFGSHMVVVICHGGAAAGTRLYEVAEDARRVRVRYQAGSVQTGPEPDQSEAAVAERERRLAHQYTFRVTFVVLPATGKPVVFEEGVGGTLSSPAEWKERARRPTGARK